MNNYWHKLLLSTFVIMLFLLLRVTNLKADMANTDSYRWYVRSRNFLNAFKSRNLKDTYQRYHPGIALMYENSLVQQLWYKYKLTKYSHDVSFDDTRIFTDFDYTSKLANVLVLAFLFGIQLMLLSKLYSTRVALLYGFFASTEPYLLGIDRWFHLTSLEVYLAFVAILLILVWRKSDRRIFLILSSVMFALALLTKVSQVILVPVFGLVILTNFRDKKSVTFKNLGIWFFIILVTIILL